MDPAVSATGRRTRRERAVRMVLPLAVIGVLSVAILNAPSQHQSALFGTGTANDALRKAGHIVAYATFAVAAALAIGAVRVRGGAGILRAATDRWAILGAWAVTALVAMADEFHQSFVPDRTSSWLDVALDVAAAVAGLAILSIWARRRERRLVPR